MSRCHYPATEVQGYSTTQATKWGGRGVTTHFCGRSLRVVSATSSVVLHGGVSSIQTRPSAPLPPQPLRYGAIDRQRVRARGRERAGSVVRATRTHEETHAETRAGGGGSPPKILGPSRSSPPNLGPGFNTTSPRHLGPRPRGHWVFARRLALLPHTARTSSNTGRRATRSHDDTCVSRCRASREPPVFYMDALAIDCESGGTSDSDASPGALDRECGWWRPAAIMPRPMGQCHPRPARACREGGKG